MKDHGKLPVRGKPRMNKMVIPSATTTNIRRVHGYQEKLREEKRKGRPRPNRRCDQGLFGLYLALASAWLSSAIRHEIGSRETSSLSGFRGPSRSNPTLGEEAAGWKVETPSSPSRLSAPRLSND